MFAVYHRVRDWHFCMPAKPGHYYINATMSYPKMYRPYYQQ